MHNSRLGEKCVIKDSLLGQPVKLKYGLYQIIVCINVKINFLKLIISVKTVLFLNAEVSRDKGYDLLSLQLILSKKEKKKLMYIQKK